MADQRDAGRRAGDEPLQPRQAVEVEIVGRLVEQEHVEAREEQRGQADPAASPPDSVVIGWLEQPLGQTELGPHLGRSACQVGSTERQPAIERGGVAVVGPGRRRRRGRPSSYRARRRPRDTGAALDMLEATVSSVRSGSWAR